MKFKKILDNNKSILTIRAFSLILIPNLIAIIIASQHNHSWIMLSLFAISYGIANMLIYSLARRTIDYTFKIRTLLRLNETANKIVSNRIPTGHDKLPIHTLWEVMDGENKPKYLFVCCLIDNGVYWVKVDQKL